MNVTSLLDDLDGGPADRTVRFSWQDAQYEIDLSERNAEALRALLARYIAAARPVSNPMQQSEDEQPEAEPSEAKRSAYRARIRQWARENGYPVFGRGKVPRFIVEAYEQYAGAPAYA